MSDTLSDRFARGPKRIRHDGATVHAVHSLDVRDGDELRITRVRSSTVRAQALKLAADRGTLTANGVAVPEIAIWSHNAPESVVVSVSGRRVRSVDIWNAWSFDGVDTSWLGNAGLIVEREGRGMLVRCSDGIGSPNFDDLVLRIEHNPAAQR